MKAPHKVKKDLEKKFNKVIETPASFDFFVAIHDFIEHIEANSSLSRCLSSRANRDHETNILGKYGRLREIYQGLEDADSTSRADFGHARYMVINELTRIRNSDVSDSNSFWKRRELFRKLTGEIYERLNPAIG
ncbi:hypothetical protein HY504_01290 [Candidatus Wolfebacteria bacterium]|nr:hypothetical protein [Candidatus Wolfebacteria bacterium]